MSDDDKDGDWDANSGLTLPGNNQATHNIGLSPLFINRAGMKGTMTDFQTIHYRGTSGPLWSSNATPKYLSFDNIIGKAHPSDYNFRTSAWFLRCLVSTTNS